MFGHRQRPVTHSGGSSVHALQTPKGGRLRARLLCILLAQAVGLQGLTLHTTAAYAQSDNGAGDSGEGSDDCSTPKNQKEEDDSDPDEGGDEPDAGNADASSEEGGDEGDGGGASGDASGTDGNGTDGSAEGFGDAWGGEDGEGGGGGGGGGRLGEINTLLDPVNVKLADKRHVQVDYVGAGAAALRWARGYHSNSAAFPAAVTQKMGNGWRSHYDRSVQTLSASTVRLHRANGMTLDYAWNGSAWVSAAPGGALTKLSNGWQYINHRNAIEGYDANGRLVSLSQRGQVRTLSYDGSGRLAAVVNPFGRSISFAYDATSRVSVVTLPGGGTLGYGYDTAGRLVSVRYTDNSTRQYQYENAGFPNALTGVTDESGRRRLTWGYDSAGRPNYGHYGNGVNAVSISYSGGTVYSTDARGTQRTRTYATVAGRPVLTSLQTGATSDSAATSWSYGYDGNGQISGATSRTGEVRTASTDGRGRLLSFSRAAGTGIAATVQHTWHPSFRIPTQSVSAGVTTNRTVDSYGRVTQVSQVGVDGSNRTLISKTYNAQQLLSSVVDARGSTSSFGYDAAGNLRSWTDGLGRTTAYANHDVHGRPTRITRPDGTVTVRTYDTRGRLGSRSVNGATTSYSYDGANRLMRTTAPDGSWRQRAYDNAGMLSSITNHRGESTVLTRDVDGKVTTSAVYTASGALSQKASQTYDKRGRVSAWLDSRGYRTVASYSSDARLYAITDPLSRTKSQSLDLLDRATAISQPNTTAARNAGGPATVTATNSFHPSYRRNLQATDTVNIATNYSHDGFHRRVVDSGPDAGSRSWTRNAAGDVTSFADSRGISTSVARDALGRITQLAPSGATVTSMSYVPGRSDNLLASTIDAAGMTNWTYDSVGRLLGKTQAVSSVTLSLSMVRNAAGQVTSMTYPSGLVVGYGYDADRVSSISVGGITVISNIGYLPRGSTPTGWRWSTGANYSRSFDSDGLVTQVTLGPVTRTYGYDAAGRITSQTDVGGAANGTTTVAYDEAGQLIGFSGPGGSYSYAYDSNGNRLSFNVNGTSVANTYQSGTNRIVSAPNGTYTYDAVGNPISDGYYTLIYDANGRMVQFNAPADYRVARRFNAQGLRLSSVASTWVSPGGTLASSGTAIATVNSTRQPALAPLHARLLAARNSSSKGVAPPASE